MWGEDPASARWGSRWSWAADEGAAGRQQPRGRLCKGKLEAAAGPRSAGIGHQKEALLWPRGVIRLRRPHQLGSTPGSWQKEGGRHAGAVASPPLWGRGCCCFAGRCPRRSVRKILVILHAWITAHLAFFCTDEAAGVCGLGTIRCHSSRGRSQASGLQVTAEQIRGGGPRPDLAVQHLQCWLQVRRLRATGGALFRVLRCPRWDQGPVGIYLWETSTDRCRERMNILLDLILEEEDMLT